MKYPTDEGYLAVKFMIVIADCGLYSDICAFYVWVYSKGLKSIQSPFNINSTGSHSFTIVQH